MFQWVLNMPIAASNSVSFPVKTNVTVSCDISKSLIFEVFLNQKENIFPTRLKIRIPQMTVLMIKN